jgi:hypothetical protein
MEVMPVLPVSPPVEGLCVAPLGAGMPGVAPLPAPPLAAYDIPYPPNPRATIDAVVKINRFMSTSAKTYKIFAPPCRRRRNDHLARAEI